MILIDLKHIIEMKVLLCLIMQTLLCLFENLEVLVIALLYGLQKEQCKLGIPQDIYLVVLFLLALLSSVLGKVGILGQSQHYAGTAFDVGQNFTPSKRNTLRNTAKNSGVWSYVEPASLTPTWVHFDRRQVPYACSSGGYPLLKKGNLSVYVLILQDCLNTLGFSTGSLDGIFGNKTLSAVKRYQSSKYLSSDGIVGCNTWRSLVENAIGTGRTSTTID